MKATKWGVHLTTYIYLCEKPLKEDKTTTHFHLPSNNKEIIGNVESGDS